MGFSHIRSSIHQNDDISCHNVLLGLQSSQKVLGRLFKIRQEGGTEPERLEFGEEQMSKKR